METLPDGPYHGVTHPNGSTTVVSLVSGAVYDFDLIKEAVGQTRQSDYAIAKRDDAHCWGYQLDHGGVDEAAQALKNWAGSGQQLTSGGTTNYFGYNMKGVYVYYCINWTHSQGNLDTKDVSYALGMMDSACPAYEAGYFQWPCTPEIVGKCRSGTAVCLG